MAAKLRYIHIIQYYAARKRSLEMSRISKSVEMESRLGVAFRVYQKIRSDSKRLSGFSAK